MEIAPRARVFVYLSTEARVPGVSRLKRAARVLCRSCPPRGCADRPATGDVPTATGMCRPAGSIAGHCKGCDGADRLRAREACVMQRRATLALFSLSLARSLPRSLRAMRARLLACLLFILMKRGTRSND